MANQINWQQIVPKRLTFPAHGMNVVTCLLLSRKRIISASDDHSIQMHSSETGELIQSSLGHEGGVWALAICSRRCTNSSDAPQRFHHDMLVSGSTDRTVRVWNLQTGQNTHVFAGHTSTVRCIALARPVWIDVEDTTSGVNRKEKWPKHTMIISGSRDETLRVWRLPAPGESEYRWQKGEEQLTDEEMKENPYHLMVLKGHKGPIRAVAVHGRTIVSGSYDTTVRVWDLITGDVKFILTGHQQKVYSVVIDSPRQQICSASMDGTVRIWSLQDGSTKHTLSGHCSLVGLLSISSSTLVSASADALLMIWDLKEGVLLHRLEGHKGAITCVQHDDEKVISGSDGTLAMWNTKDGSRARILLKAVTGVWQVTFDRRFLVAAINQQNKTFVEVWDFTELTAVAEGEPPGKDDTSDNEDGVESDDEINI
ncbi:SCF ubiquitin ligase complex subunit cdc4 [Tulasnella sp. JGI-2019a]|nr:SCF ubiquitin ligase complex subunit cdc4 [Tulasnella sp. JGI-2019a]KAG9006244.1 SCF ubiquitin ligase complex subunit cdc4 [Tulasnella sp. JGI-2019a]